MARKSKVKKVVYLLDNGTEKQNGTHLMYVFAKISSKGNIMGRYFIADNKGETEDKVNLEVINDGRTEYMHYEDFVKVLRTEFRYHTGKEATMMFNATGENTVCVETF